MLLASVYFLYAVIVTALYKNYSRHVFFHFYCLFGDFLFILILVALTGFQASPFVFLFYPLIIAAASLDLDVVYKGTIILLVPLAYSALALLSKAGLANFGLFVVQLFGLCCVILVSFLLAEKLTQKNIMKIHLKQLEEAQNTSRIQTKEKEEKELVLIDKSHKLLSLIEVSRSMGATNRLDELLELVVNKACETLNTKISFLMLIKEKELRIVYSLGISEMTKQIFKTKVGEGVLGQAAAKHEVLSLNYKDNPNEMRIFSNSFERIKNMLCVPLISPQDKKLIGILGVANLLIGERFTEEHSGYLYTLATDASIFVRNRILFEELEKSYIEMIQALAQAVEARDPYTYGHIDRVKTLSVLLAQKLNASPSQVDLIKTAAILHDLGKLGTPDSILLKPGALTDDERKIMQEHVTKSADILRDISSLDPKVLGIVKHHHERYDGGGYPDGLKEDKIPLESQIISIADTYDAIITDRPYRKGLAPEEAISILKEVAGTQFNPKLVELFIELYKAGKLK